MKRLIICLCISAISLLAEAIPCLDNDSKLIQIRGDAANKCVSVDVLQSSESIYEIRVRIHGVYDKTVVRDGTAYHQLFFEDGSTLHDVGLPALPVINQMIGLPLGCTYTGKITNEVWTDINVGKIYPAQEPHTGISADTAFAVDETIFNNQLYIHDLLNWGDIQRWKGIDNTILTICPFRYYPCQGKLSVLSEFTLTVTFPASRQNGSRIVRATEKDLRLFSNKNFLRSEKSEQDNVSQRSSDEDYEYLVIVGNMPGIENSQAMKLFRRWKAIKGYKTKLVSTSAIGSDSASIKNYICQEYPHGLEYVLFVGDHTKIPLPVLYPKHYQYDHQTNKSDYWYGCLDGNNDTQAEVAIGRFVVNDSIQFLNMVNKTMKYEGMDHGWTDKVLLSAHRQNDYLVYYQGIMDGIRYATYSQPMTFSTAYGASVADGGDGAGAAYVYNCINGGINLFAFNGHGHADAMHLGTYGLESDIRYSDTAQMDSTTCSVFVTTGCFNGDFTNDNSILAYYTQSDHCAVAFCANTESMYTNAANRYLQEFFPALLNDSIWNLGSLNVNSHIRSFPVGITAVDNAFCFICGGDPSLEIWTGEQIEFNGISVNMIRNNLIIEIQDVDSFNVNIVSEDGELIDCYKSLGSNCITVPVPSASCDIVLDKHNYVPHVIHFCQNYLQNETITRNTLLVGNRIKIGYDVTDTMPYGNVVIQPGAKVRVLTGVNGVTVKNGFECKQGAEFTIQ